MTNAQALIYTPTTAPTPPAWYFAPSTPRNSVLRTTTHLTSRRAPPDTMETGRTSRPSEYDDRHAGRLHGRSGREEPVPLPGVSASDTTNLTPPYTVRYAARHGHQYRARGRAVAGELRVPGDGRSHAGQRRDAPSHPASPAVPEPGRLRRRADPAEHAQPDGVRGHPRPTGQVTGGNIPPAVSNATDSGDPGSTTWSPTRGSTLTIR